MRPIIALLTGLCLCAQAYATDPPASAAATSAQPAAASATATPSTSAAAASTTAPAAATSATSSPSGVSDVDDKRLRSIGYKPVVQSGQTYYCRSEPVLGSRFEHKICRTPEQLSADRNEGRKQLEKAQIETLDSGK